MKSETRLKEWGGYDTDGNHYAFRALRNSLPRGETSEKMFEAESKGTVVYGTPASDQPRGLGSA
jgi:hypothetical protein